MTVTPRESVLAFLTLSVALFGASAMFARTKMDRWKELAALQQQTQLEIDRDRALLGEAARWEEEFRELSGKLPAHPMDKKMDVYWLAVMDQIASRHGLRITKRRVAEEKREGDVYELPIEVEHDGWQAPLASLVHFLFDLQTEGAMLDVRQLRIKPMSNGQLIGRFSLYCAYRRENGGAEDAPAPDGGTP